MIKARAAIASLVVSGALLVGIAKLEGYSFVAEPPVPGDIATGGFGTTGHGIVAGDKIEPTRALVYLLADADASARAVRRCAPVPMHQHEFDAFVSLTYNIGEKAFCNSTAARKLQALDYAGACEAILPWDKFQGKRLKGLSNRRQSEYRLCIGEAV